MAQNNMLGDVEETYQRLETNFTKIFNKCRNAAEQQLFRDTYSAARDAYWKGVTSKLIDNNELVKGIRQELKAANANVKAELKGLRDIASFLKLAAQAVRLAAAVVALGAAA